EREHNADGEVSIDTTYSFSILFILQAAIGLEIQSHGVNRCFQKAAGINSFFVLFHFFIDYMYDGVPCVCDRLYVGITKEDDAITDVENHLVAWNSFGVEHRFQISGVWSFPCFNRILQDGVHFPLLFVGFMHLIGLYILELYMDIVGHLMQSMDVVVISW
ncbi:hypothetical protein ACJX0J_019009, partial [Zea mays]